jgi:hypothetical protein
MSKIKLIIVVLVFGLAGVVYASNPVAQDNHANHGKASCCSAGAACCNGGSCCAGEQNSESCSAHKDSQKNSESCCKPGAACCDGSSCCGKSAESTHEHSKQVDSKQVKKARKESPKNGTAQSATDCCSGGSCCDGGACCAKHKSQR